MRCEGLCNRSFRNGEKVYAVPTRIVIVRNGHEQVTDAAAYYCSACYMGGRRPSLFATGVARVG